MNAIKITAAFAAQLETNNWVIVNGDYAVGAYKSRQAARDAKAAEGLEGSIKNKVDVEFEVVAINQNSSEISEAAKKAAEEVKPYGFEHHGLVYCPKCGIHLDNGVGDAEMEVNGVTKTFTKTKEYWCMGCGEEFGPDLKPVAPKADKPAKVNGPILHKSEIDHPCKRVWGIAEDMKKVNPNVKRGAVLAACVAQGIAYYTARTQYQQWLGIQKEMAQREASQKQG